MSDTQAGDALIGRVIADAYVIQRLVGVGGMGRVYRAEQRALGRVVAVKVVHRHLLEDRDSISRFYTEARAASSLNHPNSVSIYDFGRTDDGILYLVMEFLRGKDLARLMHDEGPLPLSRIVDIGIGVCGALGEAHARGVVHRDLKPENIIIERLRSGTDLVKVVDFGLAKIRGTDSIESAQGLVAGTPDYMAPEQARALEADGRSDLYALGVVLFELMTGRLPFIDDTPSKVMTRHVLEAPPHPSQVAPYRGIPDALSEIVLRALAKAPDERFRDAEDMARALRRARSAVRITIADGIRCPLCGAINEEQRAFCGDCGHRLAALSSGAIAGLASMLPAGGRPLVGRDRELSDLQRELTEVSRTPRIVYVTGSVGVGKTRLLAELCAQAHRDGWVVAEARPHASGAPVAYGAVRHAVSNLLNVPAEKLGQLAEDDSLWPDRVASAGMRELLSPEGMPGVEGSPRYAAVAAALARAVELAATRSSRGRVLLAVDDLHRCDSLTTEVLAVLEQHHPSASLMIVVSGQPALPLSLRFKGHELVLSDLAVAHAHEISRVDRDFLGRHPDGLMPLYLEQLRALEWQPSESERELPSLADVIMRRLDTLDIVGRRVLQAASVCGDSMPFEALSHLVLSEELSVLSKLTKHGFLQQTESGYAFAHHYLRDMVAASIPAETRKALHARAFEWASQKGEPLEVRAEHAFRAGDVMAALVLLERMGQEALKRGDPGVASLAFRRGLELARREMLEKGEEALDPAIVSFSRQLGEAMLWRGDVTAAAGVLNEALQLAGPRSLERARMTMLLGRVAERRDRPREASSKLGLAAELARTLRDLVLEARAQWAISRVRKAEGDTLGAHNALRVATECLMTAEPHSARRAQVEVELGELLVELGDVEAANEHLERALDLARDGGWDATAAAALGVLASIDELAGRRELAAERYREAMELAAEAGDVRGRDRFRRATAALTQP